MKVGDGEGKGGNACMRGWAGGGKGNRDKWKLWEPWGFKLQAEMDTGIDADSDCEP